MNKKTSPLKLLVLAIFAMIATGCATGNHFQSSSAHWHPDFEAHYTVKPGDRLTGISKKLTGDQSHWQTIATYNNIENPDLLAVGDILAIPGSLLRDYFPDNISAASTVSDLDNSKTAASTRNLIPNASALALQRPKRLTEKAEDDVIVAPVVRNRSFTLEPLQTTNSGQVPVSDSFVVKIKVNGSYYPKGIYQQPANYAPLMMRVSPGTILELELEVNDWYKVKTDKGIGYIRKDDSTILEF